MPRVIWVDEDERIWAPERSILRGLGFDVVSIGDASSALSVLSLETPSSIELLILDVMLLPGDVQIAFSEQITNGGTETGLALAEKLCSINSEFGPRILFFSRSTRASIISKTKFVASRIGANYLPKSINTQGRHFIEWLQQHGFVTGG
jgi:CheY-like chemotaxis protein